ncbi:cell envelope integrity protein CreD [Ereboglobus luteus]|uniref:Cell envelope integrity protein CreD n=1 Tax=Ereboglobus luteus TaxID=1796921 RepID=A0A2U8E5T3_9BACT|nr:cell envelope integrity protein CreD [Ereboglobus luteus]AWI10186.1 cell envelope integrity protein CreD [Ereboglobus luteus]
MNTDTPQPPQISRASQDALVTIRNWFAKRALFFKIILIGFLALVLLIPLGLVSDTLSERQSRYAEAVASIVAPWGGSQRITGPVLAIPFTHKVETEEWVVSGTHRFKEKKSHECTVVAYFLPDHLNVKGTIEPSARKRSIYTAHVYSALLQISGKFARPDFNFPGYKDITPQWDQARVGFLINDLRGVRESLTLAWDDERFAMQPGDGIYAESGLHAQLSAQAAQNGGDFSLSLTLNGSNAFEITPLARSTKMALNSPWPDPSFCGDYLPVTRNVTPEGFEARWETSFYARKAPQQWTGNQNTIPARELAKGSFGVRMMPAISAYRIVERSIKYGVLFIALVFTVFFLFEIVARVRLGALNYLLVGATLCVFFLGLLALSEFVAFGLAYAGSGAIATLMIGFYCARILRSAKRALAVGAMLGGVYAYLYFVLRMEDFSLIAGTAALFAVLGAVMYATRNLRNGSRAGRDDSA